MSAKAAAIPCPQCGTDLRADAPEGLCPRCLLGLNLGAPPHDLAGATAAEPPVSSPPPEPATPAEIARHFPHLEILECLGRGGMGVVYKARQPRLNRFVALKVLAPGRETDPLFAERFTREAQALARLSHPAIVAIHDFGEANGLFYLVMEYVDGVSLRALCRDAKAPPANALDLVPQICEALQFAHQQGVVHRDIKPENILIDAQGRVKIADFGIAKLFDPSGRPEPLTEARSIIGTPHYMAPEQVERPATVDHRADIYSIGVVLYVLLPGELPLGKFSPPSQRAPLDPRLDPVVMRSLEKEPARRYQQAGDLKTDIEIVRSSPPPADHDTKPSSASSSRPRPDSVPQPFQSRQLQITAVGLALTAIANLGFGLTLMAAALVLVALDRQHVDMDGVLPPIVDWLQTPDPSGIKSIAFLGLTIQLSGSALTLAGALAMRRLRAYRLALCASALAMVLPPGNLLGFPLGLGALFVLGRRITQNAFLEERTSSPPDLRRSRRLGLLGVAALALTCLILAAALYWMESTPQTGNRINATLALERQTILEHQAARAAAENFAPPRAPVASPSIPGTLAVPPAVIETVPVAGTSDVDPGLNEIRVTFSTAMMPGGWSWAQWSPESFPEIVGEPRYLADKRTCVLPVRLQPNRTYAIWLNTEKFQNFKDTLKRPALPYLLTFKTREIVP